MIPSRVRRPKLRLPRYLRYAEGTVGESFQNAGDWTVTTGNTPTLDTTNKVEGSGSIALDTTGATSHVFYKTVNWDLSEPANREVMSLALRWAATTFTPENISIDLSNDSGFTNYFRYTFTPVRGFYNHEQTTKPWRYYRIHSSEWTPNGSASWGSNIIRLRFTVANASSYNHIFNFDEFRYGLHYHPAVVITFDDARDGPYSYKQRFVAHNMRVGFAIPTQGPETIDANFYMKWAMVERLHAMNHAILNHAVRITADWNSLTQAQIEQDIQDNVAELTLHNMGELCDTVLVQPGGYWDTDVEAAQAAQGIQIARSVAYTSSTQTHFTLDRIPSIQTVDSVQIDQSVAWSTIQSHVDLAKKRQCVMSFLLHDLREDSAVGAQTRRYIFDQLIGYIASARIPVLTFDQLYDLTQRDLTVEIVR